MKIIGIILIVVGIAGVAYGGFSWTRQKTVFEAGPIEIKTDKHESLPIPPLVGVLCIAAGGALLFTRNR
jgi:hypothetical protein